MDAVHTNVIKRNGEEVNFDLDKIVNAINAANKAHWTVKVALLTVTVDVFMSITLLHIFFVHYNEKTF